jgi:hypothetical protein
MVVNIPFSLSIMPVQVNNRALCTAFSEHALVSSISSRFVDLLSLRLMKDDKFR